MFFLVLTFCLKFISRFFQVVRIIVNLKYQKSLIKFCKNTKLFYTTKILKAGWFTLIYKSLKLKFNRDKVFEWNLIFHKTNLFVLL